MKKKPVESALINFHKATKKSQLNVMQLVWQREMRNTQLIDK